MKEIAVICWHPSVDDSNGYAYAFDLYKFLSQKYKINIIVPRESDFFSERIQYINSNMQLRNICMEVTRNSDNLWGFYLSLPEIITQCVKKKLKDAISESDMIVCDSVYFVSLVRSIFPDRKIFFRSLDIEYDKTLWGIKYHSWPTSYKKSSYLLEKKAYEDADIVFALTQGDIDRIINLYHIDSRKFRVLPICSINVDIISRYIPDKRPKDKVTKGILISSIHIDNAETFLNKVREIKNFELHMVGKSCSHLTNIIDNIPSNVFLHEVVSEEEKNQLLTTCDFALHISEMTFGVNVKISEYFSIGIPVLSNKLGVRGYNVQENIHYFPCSLETVDKDIVTFCNMDVDERYNIGLNAFKNYCNYYNYSKYEYLFSDNMDVDSKYSCFIFGAKMCGKFALSELHALNLQCIGFIDNDVSRQGEKYLGKAVYSFAEGLKIIRKSTQKIKIVIAVSLPYVKEIYGQVSEYIENEDILIAEPFWHSIMTMDAFDTEKLKGYGGEL